MTGFHQFAAGRLSTEEIKQAVPHATGVTIPACGHLVAEERPDALERILRAHFAEDAHG